MLDEDLAELGARLVALNDTGNRIGDGVQDDFAEWEREVVTERTGRFNRARSGRLVAKRTASGCPAGRREVYHYLVCSTYSDSGAASCEHTRRHRAGETEERVAEFVLGLLRDAEVLREEAERQAEGERRRLRRADQEAERLMDLALDGPFGKDEIARRAASLEAERELDGLVPGALEGRLRELEELPNLVEGCLREVRHANFASCHGLREPRAPADLCTR